MKDTSWISEVNEEENYYAHGSLSITVNVQNNAQRANRSYFISLLVASFYNRIDKSFNIQKLVE